MVARTLMKYNVKVCIVEKENDVAMGATKANSGIIHAGFDAKSGTLKALLNVQGSEMMKEITDELGVKYLNNGSLVIAFDEKDKITIQKLYKQGIENGVNNLKILNGTEIKNVEPAVSDNAICALYAPSGAIVCPYELCIAAIGNAMDNGAELRLNSEVTDIILKDDFFEIKLKDELIRSKVIVNAAGIYSDKIANMIGDRSFNIYPRRGEYILLDKENETLLKSTIFRTPTELGKGILVSPTVDGNLLLGPTSVDITDKEDKNTTYSGFSRIINEANQNVNNIRLKNTITSFCGLRAVGDTGDFIINSPKHGFINVAGIESPGLSASPAIAEYVINMIKNQGFKLEENDKFTAIRKPAHFFKNAPMEEKNKIIKEHPSYGRVICRCETITEGEIVEAIHTNPGAHDVDGVKRRTRSGMGRCQGGFCSTYVADILARELNVNYESISKFGNKSQIVVGHTKENA